jgi:hypothetical protein
MPLRITKRIAKQGDNLVLIIPKDLHLLLKKGDLVEVSIDKIEELQEIEKPQGIEKLQELQKENLEKKTNIIEG